MTNYFIGWDVGGWNCDKNSRSRDAIVILDGSRQIVGTSWRGNLRVTINDATNTGDWLQRLFGLCEAETPSSAYFATIGIDTPLGFSRAFLDLIGTLKPAVSIGGSETNPYLFRETERFLFRQGIKPLSPIKDMIGSQATKGMHVLAKFTPMMAQCGVWTDGVTLTAIEAYPSACRQSLLFQKLLRRYIIGERDDPPGLLWIELLDHQDKLDALTCALVAHTFEFQADALAHPSDFIPMTEGWIWAPKDALQPDTRIAILTD